MTVLQYFRKVHDLPIRESQNVSRLKFISNNYISDIQIVQCFYVDIGEHGQLSSEESKKLEWLLTDPLDRKGISQDKCLDKRDNGIVIEIGPR